MRLLNLPLHILIHRILHKNLPPILLFIKANQSATQQQNVEWVPSDMHLLTITDFNTEGFEAIVQANVPPCSIKPVLLHHPERILEPHPLQPHIIHRQQLISQHNLPRAFSGKSDPSDQRMLLERP